MQLSDLSDKEIIDGLIGSDEQVTRYFFYVKCAPILGRVIKTVYDYRAEKNELVGELYIYLKENDWYKLRRFDYRSRLTTWLSVVATRFFVNKKMRERVIENPAPDALKEMDDDGSGVNSPYRRFPKGNGYDPINPIIKMGVHQALEKMPNARYREVLYELFINDMEPEELAVKMSVTIANVYNLKHRAIQQITEVMNKEVSHVK